MTWVNPESLVKLYPKNYVDIAVQTDWKLISYKIISIIQAFIIYVWIGTF